MQRNMSNRRGNNGSYSAYDRRIDEANRTLLERENDEHWAELGRSAALLKSVRLCGGMEGFWKAERRWTESSACGMCVPGFGSSQTGVYGDQPGGEHAE
jgi:hypothetical protein